MAEKSRRGFAAMDREKQKEIASKGGKAAHAKGSAHEFTSDQAREAGRKGGRIAHAKGTAHEFTREEAQAAGRKGGRAHRRAPESTANETPLPIPAPLMSGPSAPSEPGAPMPGLPVNVPQPMP